MVWVAAPARLHKAASGKSPARMPVGKAAKPRLLVAH
jgi:hypothetical protein